MLTAPYCFIVKSWSWESLVPGLEEMTSLPIAEDKTNEDECFVIWKRGDLTWISWFKLVQWPFQEPIYWRYLPYIRPIFQAYVRGYIPKIWPYIWPFRILEFPLICGWIGFCESIELEMGCKLRWWPYFIILLGRWSHRWKKLKRTGCQCPRNRKRSYCRSPHWWCLDAERIQG